eukprot:TRINITY_DN13294_c0_g1_i1.p2 TRINITY_DN13294_c0_g1~~TRINITY_DN13294_c0_g1_i1.p2  ORF type:complete len:203 (+),score=39.00 TRINITY_DN13294_c0_g1_i1:209-817(+)
MHGLGDSPAGWSHIEKQLGVALEPRNIVWRFPPAPTARVTVNQGAMMNSWMDLADWPIGLSARDDKPGLLASVAIINNIIEELVADGIRAERITVGGFSQGGAIALLTVSRSKHKLGACVCLSGWLTLREEYSNAFNKQTPVFWGHGKRDNIVLPEQQTEGVRLLSAAGVGDVVVKQYPVAHSPCAQEMADLTNFLKQHIAV